MSHCVPVALPLVLDLEVKSFGGGEAADCGGHVP